MDQFLTGLVLSGVSLMDLVVKPHVGHGHAVLGQGAGLIGADSGSGSQGLHGFQVLHQAVLLGHTLGGQGQTHLREEGRERKKERKKERGGERNDRKERGRGDTAADREIQSERKTEGDESQREREKKQERKKRRKTREASKEDPEEREKQKASQKLIPLECGQRVAVLCSAVQRVSVKQI